MILIAIEAICIENNRLKFEKIKDFIDLAF
jgi:hypothetical protein